VAPLATAGAGPAAGGAVVVATSVDDDERTLRRLRWVLAGAAVVAAALAALGATLLTRRGLRPLARLSAGARDVERTGDPSRRLPHPATRDELAELTDTLNAMLAALERARERERRFVADASHELRTPLTALRGNAAYVARHGADREALADLEADAARLARLLDDLLALAREDAAEPPAGIVDLAVVAREAAAGEDGVVVLAVAPAPVRGDAGALRRAVANLVGNARRYGPPDGRVEVAIEYADGRVRLRVTDEGPGLDADEAARAFERFWRGRASRDVEGSGLGLAIVRATAERHGGTATVEDGRVVLDLPAHDTP
jgi:signal transduction histidine kinase